MINTIQLHNSVARDTGTVDKILDPPTKYHNTTINLPIHTSTAYTQYSGNAYHITSKGHLIR